MPTKKSKKRVPHLADEKAVRDFWSSTDSAGYVDWSGARRARFPHLKPSTKTISLRLPEGLLADLKVLANKRDVPYQSLLKLFLAERLEEELRSE